MIQAWPSIGARVSIYGVYRATKRMMSFFCCTETLRVILQNIKTHYRVALLSESAEIQAAVKRLTDYYYNYWIDQVTPEGFSVFGLPNRTNNLVEAWHLWFNKRCRTSPGNFWDFIRKLSILIDLTLRFKLT